MKMILNVTNIITGETLNVKTNDYKTEEEAREYLISNLKLHSIITDTKEIKKLWDKEETRILENDELITIGKHGFRVDIYGAISFEDMKNAIERAEGIDEVATLRSILEDADVYNSVECSSLLYEKELIYNL